MTTKRTPPKRARTTLSLEALERRELPAAGLTSALLDATNRYAYSANSADLGSPIVPLYTDFQAGGTYGAIDDSVRVTLDGNDMEPARGPTSFRMTWDGSGPNGYFQFGLGTTVANRPRDTTDWGLAHRVRFLAKGDLPGQQLQVNVFKVGTGGGGVQQVASVWLTLGSSWTDHSVALPAGVRPQDLHAVQFLMDTAHNFGGGTVRLDEVRVDTDGIDRLRVVQSYTATEWGNTGSPLNTTGWRDAFVYPNRSFLYDNALAIKALVAMGGTAAHQGRDIADGVLATALSGLNGYFNARNSGHTLLGNGTPRSPLSQLRTLGDNSWFGLALLDVYRLTGNGVYLTRAREISDWAEITLKTFGPLKGYRGGFDDTGVMLGYRSTEHNADFFQLNRQIAALLTQLGDTGSASSYAGRASHAGDFVMAMFDNTGGKFWTGTSTGDTLNTSSVPLDAQLWTFLTLGQAAPYASAIDWTRPIQWAEQNLVEMDGSLTGFTYSSQSTADTLWFEGIGSGAVVYQLLSETTKHRLSLQTLQQATGIGGLPAASSNGLVDTALGAVYDARRGVAPTAWAYLAGVGRNPFDLAPEAASYVDFGSGGFWRHSPLFGWVGLSSANPETFSVAGNGDVYVDFAAGGFHRWSPNTGWLGLSSANPEAFQIAGSGEVYVDFGAGGLWRYSGSWSPLSSANPEALQINSRGEVFVDFGAGGFHRWNTIIGWQAMSSGNPEVFQIASNDDIYVDFAAGGLWRFNGSWFRLSSANVETFQVTPSDEVYADLGAGGFQRWFGGSWAVLSGSNAEAFRVVRSGVACVDFGTGGLWRWSAAEGWQQLSTDNPDSVQVDGHGDLSIDYGIAGLWRWGASSGWLHLSGANAEDIQLTGSGELCVDFGLSGLWRWNGVWVQLSSANAEMMRV